MTTETQTIKNLVLLAYDAGFKYAAEKFRSDPNGEKVQSVREFIEQIGIPHSIKIDSN